MAKGSTIVIDTKDLGRIAAGLNGLAKEMPGAAASALNRTVDYTYTRIGKLVSEEYNISAKEAKNKTKKNKCSKGNLTASLYSTGNLLTVHRFLTSSKKAGAKGPIKLKIKRKDGSKVMSSSPKPFVQTIKGTTNVFVRQGEKRYPIDAVRTLSIPQMITAEGIGHKIQTDAMKKLDERITHEIEYRLNKIQKGR